LSGWNGWKINGSGTIQRKSGSPANSRAVRTQQLWFAVGEPLQGNEKANVIAEEIRNTGKNADELKSEIAFLFSCVP
jgi:hypothetical protein